MHMKENSIAVASIQMNCHLGDKEANLAKAEELILKAVERKSKLIVLPELFNTGYRVEERDFELAESIPGPTTDWLQQLCSEFDIFIVACILEKSPVRGLVYDTAFIVSKDGVVGTYRKNKLWDQEKNRFLKGSDNEVFDIGFAKLGLQICYEIGFPEPSRYLSSHGADILIYPSAFGKARDYAWKIASQARALENGSFVITSNRTGEEKQETLFAGISRIVDPQGTVLAEATLEDEVIISEIDLDLIGKQRNAIPYLRDFDRDQFIWRDEHE